MPQTDRPNPDNLLAAVSLDENSHHRGRLKIFFGACAGVGKTFKMLEAAHAQKKRAVDVAIGVVVTHGRRETEALIAGLEIIPSKKIEYKGVTLSEFDLDAALARKPALILIDELAHTNAPGSRNLKRWQDIEELLQAGIDVLTTLNTQHVESLNDTVAKITGILVRETIPDFVFDGADEVELVDLPVAELLQRLKEGKVYLPEQAGRAAENFFQEGTLFALREIALRKTAQRVDLQMHRYRDLHAVRGVWQAGERLLVCVGSSPFSAQLIRRTKQLADESKAPWVAVYVETLHKKIGDEEHEAVEKQLRFAQSLGAETAVLQGISPEEEILKFAREKNVTKIILGKPVHSRWRDIFFGSFVERIVRGSGDIEIYSIPGKHEKEERKPQKTVHSRWTQYAASFAIIVGWTTLIKNFLPGIELVNLAMTYLALNVLIAVRYGQGPSTVMAVVSVTLFDFFFVPPYMTFRVSDSKYFVTFFVMLTVTVVTSRLMGRLKQIAESSSTRERYTANLYALNREILKSRTTGEVCTETARHLSQVVQGDVMILLGSEPYLMFLEATTNPEWHFDDTDRAVSQWVCKNAKVAGFGTQTLPLSKTVFFPLPASRGVIGVVGIRPRTDSPLAESSSQNFVEAVIGQAALAIERAMLTEETKALEVDAEREGLISSLLSSVSHDLRTPLTSISGAADTLALQAGKLSQENQKQLLDTIRDESARMNRLVENILQMTKIESGNIRVKKEKHSLEEIVGSVLQRPFFKNRPIAADLPADLPLIPMDALLIEQVLVNLLENAVRYAPADSPIDIRASYKDREACIEILDRGPGVPEKARERIFEKFYRGNFENTEHQASSGSGLGLAIARGILKAHEGPIGVKNREGGGSIFYFYLPLSNSL